MQLHDILLLRTFAILPEAISAGGLTPTTDTSLFLTTYRSHLPADINLTTFLKGTTFTSVKTIQTVLQLILHFVKDLQ